MYQHTSILKFNPTYSYYIDRSFKPPIKESPGNWIREETGYNIYNHDKEIYIKTRLHGLQIILRAEMMAIHRTLKIITTQYANIPAHIFTDCINVLYLLNTHINHPSLHNNHFDKIIIASVVEMLQICTQITTLHKVRA